MSRGSVFKSFKYKIDCKSRLPRTITSNLTVTKIARFWLLTKIWPESLVPNLESRIHFLCDSVKKKKKSFFLGKSPLSLRTPHEILECRLRWLPVAFISPSCKCEFILLRWQPYNLSSETLKLWINSNIQNDKQYNILNFSVKKKKKWENWNE